jgi:hypothetical protein
MFTHIKLNIAFSIPHFGPPGEHYLDFKYLLQFGCAAYKSDKCKLSASYKSVLAVLEKRTNVHIYCVRFLFAILVPELCWAVS